MSEQQINQAMVQMEKLKKAEEKKKKAEEKAKSIIQALQQEINESANEITTQNAEYQKQKQELEIAKNLALEKYQKDNAELESKKFERNANFAKKMTSLREQLKDKINWNQVDRVMAELVIPIATASAKRNRLDRAKTKNIVSISMDGLNATNNDSSRKWQSVYTEKGFMTPVDLPLGGVLLYFEVTNKSSKLYQQILVGLSRGNIPDGYCIGSANSYALQDGCDFCWLSGKEQPFKWPNGAIKPKWNGTGDVVGCGLVLNPAKELSVFFTGNGLLMGKGIPINSTANTLYPTITMCGNVSVEANFGEDLAKPFCYDIKKYAAIVFE